MIKKFVILLSIIFLFGVPSVRAELEPVGTLMDYRLPTAGGIQSVIVTQSPGGKYSHCFTDAKNTPVPWAATIYAWDLVNPGGSVVAVETGKVVYVDIENKGRVRIKHRDNLVSSYSHMSGIIVKLNQEVVKGDKLGNISNVGAAFDGKSGNEHLHFSLFNNDGTAADSSSLIFNKFKDELYIAPSNTPSTAVCGAKLCEDKMKIGSVPLGSCAKYTINNSSGTDGVSGTNGAPAVPLKEIALQPIADMVNEFYQWALGIGAGVASGIIIYGGILYITAVGNPSKQTEAKDWIKAAIYGLVLLLLSYLLLYTINPSLVGAG